MDTAVPALIIIAVILYGTLTLAHGYLTTQDRMARAWRVMEGRVFDQARTHLSLVNATTLPGDDAIEITIRNDGQTRLADFDRWDVILQYDTDSGSCARWYPHAATAEPGYNQWAIMGIYLDAARGVSEAYEPGILNPGEEMVIRVRISPPVTKETTKLASIATPNGVSAWLAFAT